MVKSEDVTPGFWYVKFYSRLNEQKIYEIVEVIEHYRYKTLEVAVPGSEEPFTLKEFEFIAPVPVPPPKES